MSHLDKFGDALIHETSCFSIDTIEKRAARFGFSQPWVLEAFAWDLELFGQLQSVGGEQLILKGGAAAQFFVPAQIQRASIDIDVIALIDGDHLNELLKSVSKRLRDPIYFRFEPYIPRKTTINLPMYTYTVFVPSSTGRVWKTKNAEIPGFQLKTDFLSLGKVPGDFSNLSDVRTFALDLAYSPICMSAGSLVGDKLLTLATESIGIPEEREEDIPKQLYDIDNLVRFNLDGSCIEDSIKAMVGLIPIEAKHRNVNVDTKEVFAQIRRCLEEFSRVDTSNGDASLKKSISDFQSIYTKKETRLPFHGWASRSLRLSFLLECLSRKLETPSAQILPLCKKALLVENRIGFSDIERASRKKMRERVKTLLLDLLKERQARNYRELKGKPPERIYWQLVHPDNVEDIADNIELT